ncbi:MAG: response regulator [Zetaproteobacteria bacterium]|nr:response regulator [Zetaproteobacteria bacterium]
MNLIQQGASVLIADDDPMFCVMLRQFFEKMGCSVRTVEDGEEAVNAFQDKAPEIVMLDGDMPNMDGFAACEFIRALDAGKEVPIFIVTALEGEAAEACAFAVNASSYITKPIHWDELRNTLSCVMEV